jgi:cysteine synthase
MSVLEAIGRTPLVALTRIGRGLPVPVLAKCEHLNPGGSVKDRLALAIVDDAEARGLLQPGATLVEAPRATPAWVWRWWPRCAATAWPA